MLCSGLVAIAFGGGARSFERPTREIVLATWSALEPLRLPQALSPPERG